MDDYERAKKTDAYLAKREVVRCAVEWYDFIDSKRGPIDAEGYAVKVVALSDAVKRWKEAQA